MSAGSDIGASLCQVSIGPEVLEFARVHRHLVVVRAEVLADQLGPVQFVVARIAEAGNEGLHRLPAAKAAILATIRLLSTPPLR